MNEIENKEVQVIEVKNNELQIIESETQETQVAINEEKTGMDAVNNFFKKAAVVGKKVAENVQEAAITTSEKIKEDNKNRRLKKFHPITFEEYGSNNFNIPNVIKIVDDAETRHIDVCQNAIGRLVNEKGVEIFYMNDEFIQASGLHFVPAPVCDAIYHVDNFDRTRFIRTDEIFSKALEEKLAELEHIAFCLGAKSCSIEIIEENFEKTHKVTDTKTNLTVKHEGSSDTITAVHSQSKSTTSSSGKITTTFSGNATPKTPRLKWFEHNDNMKNLIEMRLSKDSSVQAKTLILKGASSASMALKTAVAIDNEISKMGVKSNNNIERQAQIETNSKLVFEVIFEE